MKKTNQSKKGVRYGSSGRMLAIGWEFKPQYQQKRNTKGQKLFKR
jgi:hypothetical protein